MKGLTVEQMEFLAAKGLSLGDVIEFAKMAEAPKSKGAERIARWRAKQKESVTESVTRNVTCNALPPPIEDHTPPIPSDEGNISPKRNGNGSAKPDDVSEPVWRDFVAHRKAQKSPVSDTVVAGIRREAEKAGWEMEAAITELVSRGWRGFKAAWVGDVVKPAANGSQNEYLSHLLAKQNRHEGSPA